MYILFLKNFIKALLLSLLVSCNNNSEKNESIAPELQLDVQIISGDTESKISWSKIDDADGYSIYWNTTGNVSEQDNVIIESDIKATHSGLTNGVIYYYKLVAMFSNQVIAQSSTICAQPFSKVNQQTNSISSTGVSWGRWSSNNSSNQTSTNTNFSSVQLESCPTNTVNSTSIPSLGVVSYEVAGNTAPINSSSGNGTLGKVTLDVNFETGKIQFLEINTEFEDTIFNVQATNIAFDISTGNFQSNNLAGTASNNNTNTVIPLNSIKSSITGGVTGESASTIAITFFLTYEDVAISGAIALSRQ